MLNMHPEKPLVKLKLIWLEFTHTQKRGKEDVFSDAEIPNRGWERHCLLFLMLFSIEH